MAVDDAYTVALLHMDGADGSTTFTDEAGNVFTAAGNAQIDTAQSKFGGASGLFDGAGDYISAPDSSDWTLDDSSGSNKWTVDFWVRFNVDPGTTIATLVGQLVDTANFWIIRLNANILQFIVVSSGTTIINIAPAWNPVAAQWYHVAIVKDGTNGYMHFIDGTQIGPTTTDVSTIPNFTAPLSIGQVASANYFNGWMDELRISKGVARWTANFTPPTSAYAPAVGADTDKFFAFF